MNFRMFGVKPVSSSNIYSGCLQQTASQNTFQEGHSFTVRRFQTGRYKLSCLVSKLHFDKIISDIFPVPGYYLPQIDRHLPCFR